MYSDAEHSSDRYSAGERLLHRIALASPRLQRTLAQVETDLYARQLKELEIGDPVFVTGLPRAGTTLVLDILYRSGAFATFTYRTMPFPLSPLLWQRLSRPFQKKAVARERAHGDGMEVSVESPEAFEEMIWLNFLRQAYVRDDRLLPVAPDEIDEEFRAFFRDVIRKLMAAAGGDNGATRQGLRYLSKNNANISRIAALRRLFPSASVLVCFRHPVAHCRSLAAQHERFLSMHEGDAFARDYMRWIGHYDFGSNFRPIDFDGDGFARPERADDAFWLKYWINAYRQFETVGPGVLPFCYDDLLAAPDAALAALSRAIGLEADLSAEAARIRAPKASDRGRPDAPAELIAEATGLYERLRALSLTATD